MGECMKKLTVGILAHVDAGKTTLSEAILYKTGVVKKLGRVDNGDCLLDSDEQERRRGITIFSKEARAALERHELILVDTPGHVDFTAETERTLMVLDYAILLISAADGVTGHTKTLQRLLSTYHIPTFIFVNKMDRPDVDREKLMEDLRENLSECCVDFTDISENEDGFLEGEVAEEIGLLSGDESVLAEVLRYGSVDVAVLRDMITERKLFPVYFGSALRLTGIDELLDAIDQFSADPVYPEEFGAKVYKITRDAKGNRLTHMKLTGGQLRVRDNIGDDGEKVTEIRLYNGERYETTGEVSAGDICAILGPSETVSGMGLGADAGTGNALIEPVIRYRMLLPTDVNPRQFYPKLTELTEELPELSCSWDEEHGEIHVYLMGQVQLEILTELLMVRYEVRPSFDTGRITYKETISSSAIGVGHFEPLRHYAEVHVRLEPGEAGSGISVNSKLSVDVLSANWQKQILHHLTQKQHRGVLTGSLLTDTKITLINGKAHPKHTEGGDFRKASVRAVRQGLMQAESVLLEPYYDFVLTIPSGTVGKAMMELESRHAVLNPPETSGDEAILTGYGPVSTLMDYQINLRSYTAGQGTMDVFLRGYGPCHNTEEVVETIGYDPDADLANPASSVFCAHGAGFIVPWNEVPEHMHLTDEIGYDAAGPVKTIHTEAFDYSIDLEEIDSILKKTASANANHKKQMYTKKKPAVVPEAKSVPKARPSINKPKLLMVDGFNVIHAWEDLRDLLADRMDAATDKLIDILSNYAGMSGEEVFVVFDGYRVKGNKGSIYEKGGITVVHTMENQTADAFIERFTHEKKGSYDITVATSDGMIQQIVRGAGANVISSRELEEKIKVLANNFRMEYNVTEI